MPRFVDRPTRAVPPEPTVATAAADAINAAGTVTLLVGAGGARRPRRGARPWPSGCRRRWCSPSRPRRASSDDNAFEVGQSGLIGNHASARRVRRAATCCCMVGTDFPYREFLPDGQDRRAARRARRAHRPAHAGRPRARRRRAAHARRRCCRCSRQKTDTDAPRHGARRVRVVARAPAAPRPTPTTTASRSGCCAARSTTPTRRIRPELLAAAVDRHAAARRDLHHRHRDGDRLAVALRADDAATRRLIGSYNLGSMANAMPQALGAQALDRDRQVVAFCGDGGLSMLLGRPDHRGHPRPAGQARRLRQRPPRHGQARDGAGRAAGVRHRAAQPGLRRGRRGDRAERHPGRGPARRRRAPSPRRWRTPARCCSTSLTNPDEIAIPPKPTLAQGWGFAIAKTKEFLDSPE